jgi:hypothetical protein
MFESSGFMRSSQKCIASWFSSIAGGKSWMTIIGVLFTVDRSFTRFCGRLEWRSRKYAQDILNLWNATGWAPRRLYLIDTRLVQIRRMLYILSAQRELLVPKWLSWKILLFGRKRIHFSQTMKTSKILFSSSARLWKNKISPWWCRCSNYTPAMKLKGYTGISLSVRRHKFVPPTPPRFKHRFWWNYAHMLYMI